MEFHDNTKYYDIIDVTLMKIELFKNLCVVVYSIWIIDWIVPLTIQVLDLVIEKKLMSLKNLRFVFFYPNCTCNWNPICITQLNSLQNCREDISNSHRWLYLFCDWFYDWFYDWYPITNMNMLLIQQFL